MRKPWIRNTELAEQADQDNPFPCVGMEFKPSPLWSCHPCSDIPWRRRPRQAGWITVTLSDVIDYDVIHGGIDKVSRTFKVMAAGYDAGRQDPKEERRATSRRSRRLTYSRTELVALTNPRGWTYHANLVAEWCFDVVEYGTRLEVNPLRSVKHNRQAVGKRIDAVPTAAMAAWTGRRLSRDRSRHHAGSPSWPSFARTSVAWGTSRPR